MSERPTFTAPSARGSIDANRANRWWTETDKDAAGQALIARAKQIDDIQAFRRDQLLIYASLYSGRALSSLYQYGSVRGAQTMWPFGDVLGHRVTWNVAKSCVDTLAAKVSKNRVRAYFQTIDGNFADKLRAKGLTKWVDGLFYETSFYDDVADRCFLDACIFDGGIAKVFRQGAEIRIERVLPFELLVDEGEALYGTPSTLYQRQYVTRDALIEQYARGAKADNVRGSIESASDSDNRLTRTSGETNMIPVYEGWKLPTGDSPGRHTIVAAGHVLFDGKWERDRFPFAKLVFTPLQAGYWGQGAVEQVVGVQLELNKLLRTIQQGQHLHSVPRWTAQKGSIVDSHINNQTGAIIKYTGDRPPTPFVSPAFASDVYSWVHELYESSFREVGITALSAAGMKPQGLDAGVALREYHDVESERFVKLGQRFESFCVDIATLAVDEAQSAYSSGKSIRVKAPGTRVIEQIDWADVNLKEDAYVLRAFPTSILPSTPAGKLQTVREMIADGTIPREQGLALLDMPDLDGAMSIEVAAYRDIERIVGKILDRNEYEPPEPYTNLQLAAKMGQSAYLRARNENAPDDRLDLLCRWIDEATELQKLMPPPPPPMVPGMPGMPGAPGGQPDPSMMGGMPQPSAALPSELPV